MHDSTAPAHVDQRHALGRPLPPRARQHPVGQLRHGPQHGEPREGAQPRSPRCARSSTPTSACSASDETLNQSLEKAGRVADFLEFGELLCLDALHREESCGGHFRVEHQTEDGEALRDDERLLLRRGVGVHRRRHRARAPQGAARVRVRPPRPAELQVRIRGRRRMDLKLRVWRQEAPTDRRAVRGLRRPGRQPRHVVPRAVRRAQRAAASPRARSRSRSTTTAARASAARAR